MGSDYFSTETRTDRQTCFQKLYFWLFQFRGWHICFRESLDATWQRCVSLAIGKYKIKSLEINVVFFAVIDKPHSRAKFFSRNCILVLPILRLTHLFQRKSGCQMAQMCQPRKLKILSTILGGIFCLSVCVSADLYPRGCPKYVDIATPKELLC